MRDSVGSEGGGRKTSLLEGYFMLREAASRAMASLGVIESGVVLGGVPKVVDKGGLSLRAAYAAVRLSHPSVYIPEMGVLRKEGPEVMDLKKASACYGVFCDLQRFGCVEQVVASDDVDLPSWAYGVGMIESSYGVADFVLGAAALHGHRCDCGQNEALAFAGLVIPVGVDGDKVDGVLKLRAAESGLFKVTF